MTHPKLRYTIEELQKDSFDYLCRKIDGAHIHGEDAERYKSRLKDAVHMAKNGRLEGHSHIMITNSGIEYSSSKRGQEHLKIK